MNKLILILLMVVATSAAHAQKELIPEETNYLVLLEYSSMSTNFSIDWGGEEKPAALKNDAGKKIRRLATALNHLNEWELIESSVMTIPGGVTVKQYILKRKQN